MLEDHLLWLTSTPRSSQSDFGSKLPVYLYQRVCSAELIKLTFSREDRKQMRGVEMIGGQPSVVIQASALKGMVRSEFSAERFPCFLKNQR